jgi:Ni,Fe-hydrogenase I cytochrome b subunit
MINNAATYLLLQNGIHSDMQMTPIQTLLVGFPLLLCFLIISIGFVVDVVFGCYRAFDICMKIFSIFVLVTVIGLIVSIFV